MIPAIGQAATATDLSSKQAALHRISEISAIPTFYKPADFPLTEVFIETGTERGNSLAVALGAGYPKCLSVEFTDLFHQFALQRFKGEARVELFHGSSPDLLPQIIDPAKSTTFWLDAHYSGNNRDWHDPRYGECPLLKELDIITAAPWVHPPLICIDDAFIFGERVWEGPNHIFQRERFTRPHWPRRHEIESRLPGYRIREENYILFCMKPIVE